jgi:hypothetical protein
MATRREEDCLVEHEPADLAVAQPERVEQPELPHPLHHGHEEGVGDGEEHDQEDHAHVDGVHGGVHLQHSHHLGHGLGPGQHLEAVAVGPGGGGDGGGHESTPAAS